MTNWRRLHSSGHRTVYVFDESKVVRDHGRFATKEGGAGVPDTHDDLMGAAVLEASDDWDLEVSGEESVATLQKDDHLFSVGLGTSGRYEFRITDTTSEGMSLSGSVNVGDVKPELLLDVLSRMRPGATEGFND